MAKGILKDSSFSSFDTTQTNIDKTITYRRKVELPIFKGDRVKAWLSRADRYFSLNSSTEQERLKLVKPYLDGPALDWFILTEDRSPFRDWQDFRSRLEHQFGSPSKDAYQSLLDLRQETSVSDFTAKFERLAARLPDIPDEILAFIYFNALKPAVQTEVKKAQALHLHEIIDAAVEAEFDFRTSISCERDQTSIPIQHSLPMKTANAQPGNIPHVFMGMAQGSPSDPTFKLWGSLYGRRVKVLIATATDNFIREGLRKELNIPVKDIGPYEVDRYGHRVTGSTICRALPLQIQGYSFKLNYLPYPLAHVDFLIAVEWLSELGVVTLSFRPMEMTFKVGDFFLTLHGDPTI